MNEYQLSTPFGNVLIIGAGPAGIHVAVDVSKGWSTQIGLANRKGTHSDRIIQELNSHSFMLSSEVQVESHRHLSGEIQLCRYYDGFNLIEDMWQTLILCTPSDSYSSVVKELRLAALWEVRRIILLSPGIGSNLLVQNLMSTMNENLEIISLSTYYAATRFDPQGKTILKSVVRGMKRKVTVASNRADSKALYDVKGFIESLGIACQTTVLPIEAESRSITTYVHPPFFMNDFSLDEIFCTKPSKKYMYKLYPEGPITQHAIREMLLMWKEISVLVHQLQAEPLNLLKFLNDDNYPVHEWTLSRYDIDHFEEMNETRQEYLLYIRYSSILIDPFSLPDENGKYADFSSFPYMQVKKNKQGKWIIPRVPYEDYKKLKLLYGLGQKLVLPMPQVLKLIERFENRLSSFVQAEGTHMFLPELFIDTTFEEVNAIFHEVAKL